MVLHSRTITNFTKQKSRHGCRKRNGSQTTSRLFNTRNGTTATSVNYAFLFSNYYLSIWGFVYLENVNWWHIAYKYIYMRMKGKYESSKCMCMQWYVSLVNANGKQKIRNKSKHQIWTQKKQTFWMTLKLFAALIQFLYIQSELSKSIMLNNLKAW